MCFVRRLVLGVISLGFALVDLAPVSAAEPASQPVKPTAKRTINVTPWEENSTSPFGDAHRFGGGPDDDEREFVLSPDGKLLASEDAGGWQLELWEVESGKSLGKFGRIVDPVTLAFSPDGKTLFSAEASSNRGPPSVDSWDVAKRKLIRNLDDKVNWAPFTALAVSPDGKQLALGSTFGERNRESVGIHFWDTTSGDQITRFEDLAKIADSRQWRERYFDNLIFSPDGKTLAYVNNQKVMLVEVATGRVRGELATLPPRFARGKDCTNSSTGSAFSPDGRILAVSCSDGVVRSWDFVSGTELTPLAGHKRQPLCVQFSPDGKSLFTFGRDHVVLTWAVADLRRPPGTPEALSASALADLWKDLCGESQPALQEAILRLVASPQRSLPMLCEQLKPVPAINAEQLAQSVKDIEAADYNTRKKAADKLRTLGDLALPALSAATKGGHNPFVDRFYRDVRQSYPTPEQTQHLYALQVLERIGNEVARRLLGELAKGATESLLTQQAAAALERLTAPAQSPTGAKVDELWNQLAVEDPRPAFLAVRALAQRPKEAVPFLAERLRPLAAQRDFDDDPERIKRLIADLDADDFQQRQGASRELSKLGKRVEPALRKALLGDPGAEMKKRVETLLERMARPNVSPERLQAGRALEALELMRTEEAREVLAAFAAQAKHQWLKESAEEALRRLRR
jgi:hypothetical protein